MKTQEAYMICGIDEAGRGPVIGPLVIAGVLTDEGGVKRLKELGVRDSKILLPARREGLYREIIRLTTCQTIKIPANHLNTLMGLKSLNEIEAQHFAEVIEKLAPRVAYIDCADVSCDNFRVTLSRHLSKTSPKLVVEHKADERYPVVSAASIVAKVERDREIKRLHTIYGDFGSGYTSDKKTIDFIERCFRENKAFPDCVRKKWKTAIRASNLKLEEFY